MNHDRRWKKEIRQFFHTGIIPQVIMWVAALGFPLFLTLVTDYLSFGTTEQLKMLVTNQIGSFVYSLILVYGIYFVLIFLFRHIWASAGISAVIFLLMALIDYFKNAILQEHFLPWDFLFAKKIGSFTKFLGSVSLPAPFWGILILTVLYCLVLYFMGAELPFVSKKRMLVSPIILIALVVLTTNTAIRNRYEDIFGISMKKAASQNMLYDTHGFLTAFALNFGSLELSAPQNYTKESVEKKFAEYIPQKPFHEADWEHPDIIVVLSEAFWDPLKLEGVEFSDDPLKNYREIAAKHPSGDMVSCTFGGGTVRPEFEILTGMSTSALPTGNMPYQQFVKSPTFSYAQLYKAMGYDTLGIHTYQKSFYERDKGYPLIGIDKFYGENDLHTELHWNSGPYITDETIAEEIIYQLEQPHDVGAFIMAITMENHSLYTEKYDEQDWDIKVSSDALSEGEIISLQNYCKGAKDSDAALKTLYDYIMQREKPTVLLWYGDHLPTLGDEFSPYTSAGAIHSTKAAEWTEEEKFMMFSTPYLLFTNYDTGHEYFAEGEPVSPYMLPALMADYIGAPESLQTNFLLDAYSVSPVMSRYYDLYTPGSDPKERERILELHDLLTYDELIGKKYLDDLQVYKEENKKE